MNLCENTVVGQAELDGALIPRIFKNAGYTDFKVEPVRTRRMDDGCEFFVVRLTGRKWRTEKLEDFVRH